MITLNLLNQKKALLGASLFLSALAVSAQEPLATDNTEITGTSVESYFAQEPDDNPAKMTFAAHLVDGDETTDWAGNTDAFTDAESFLIIDLEGAYDLAEIQLLTVTGKAAPYTFDIFVSTTGIADADFTDAFTAAEKGTTGFIESNYLETTGSVLDGTYKSFVLPSVIADATYVKIFCYGRTDVGMGGASTWSTISELKFYSEGAVASIRDESLSARSVGPNPASTSISFSGIDSKVSRISLLDLSGRLVRSMKVGASKSLTMDLVGLQKGIYMASYINELGGKVNSTKVIVE